MWRQPAQETFNPFERIWFVLREYRRRKHKGSEPCSEQPLDVPACLQWSGIPLQLPAEGVGSLFHRRYRADIGNPHLTAQQLMARIQRNLADFSPRALARFKKTRGRRRRMAIGDEYTIRILGPWNGSVRVVEVKPTSFAFVTLKGHPEAGQICFRVQPHPERRDALRFEILSWARSRDMLVSLAYNEGLVGKHVQKSAWVTFCERVVEVSGGELIGDITVETEEREFQEEVVHVI